MRTCTAVLLLALLAVTAKADDFCVESQAQDQVDIPYDQFNCEKALLKTYAERFHLFVDNLNITRMDDLERLYWFMRNETDSVGLLPSTANDNRGGFIFTKTTGDILIDATLPLNQSIYPNIVTHGGRYEFSKAQLCREKQIVVYNSYYVPRIQKYARFYAQAQRGGVDNEWLTFRIHFIRGGTLSTACAGPFTNSSQLASSANKMNGGSFGLFSALASIAVLLFSF